MTYEDVEDGVGVSESNVDNLFFSLAYKLFDSIPKCQVNVCVAEGAGDAPRTLRVLPPRRFMNVALS